MSPVSTGPSLYRRHRPRSFDDVVGQEPIVRTLRNAVDRDKVHHAYLFVGSRGTGKTSMAKILAACLNCEQGPTTQPCGQCESCTSIASATSLDVIEMDAASNNSVDDIRDLRERVAFAPVSGRHKVYILDEVHMLSSQAWNAFLKTLEEPPPHTIFVLATTEVQKVLPTVVDRCHRFDFARPGVEHIAAVIRRVAAAEQIEIPSEAVALTARHATGSFRDALGTLEQLVTFSGSRVALGDVVAVLGVADTELVHETVDAVAAHDPRRALLAVARCAEGGRDPAGFIRDLEVHARELLVVRTLGGHVPPELSLTPEADQRLATQSESVTEPDMVRLLDLLGRALEAIKAGADARTQLELALIKAASPETDASTPALLARLERLEVMLAGGTTSRGGASGSDEGGSRPVAEAAPDTAPDTVRDTRRSHRPDGSAPAGAPARGAVTAVALVPEPEAQAGVEPQPALVAEPDTAPPTVPPAESDAPASGLNHPLESALALETLKQSWPAVIETVRTRNALVAAVIADAQPVAADAGELTLAFPREAEFLCRKAREKANRELVADAVRTVAGHAVSLSYELRDDLEPGARVPISEEEWIARLKTEFDAEEIEVGRDRDHSSSESEEA